MPEPRAKQFDYGVSLDREGHVLAEGATLEVPQTWAPEHLVLAGLARCSLTSLRYHARRAGITVEAEATARGVVSRRETDGRYAFAEIECQFDVALDPRPTDPEVAELLAKAERDCFVGASLRSSPTYAWNVS